MQVHSNGHYSGCPPSSPEVNGRQILKGSRSLLETQKYRQSAGDCVPYSNLLFQIKYQIVMEIPISSSNIRLSSLSIKL